MFIPAAALTLPGRLVLVALFPAKFVANTLYRLVVAGVNPHALFKHRPDPNVSLVWLGKLWLVNFVFVCFCNVLFSFPFAGKRGSVGVSDHR